MLSLVLESNYVHSAIIFATFVKDRKASKILSRTRQAKQNWLACVLRLNVD